MFRKGRYSVILMLITLFVILLSGVSGLVVAFAPWGRDLIDAQGAGSVAVVIPSFAGVLIGAYAVFKQIESSNPEVKVADELELNITLLRLQIQSMYGVCSDFLIEAKRREFGDVSKEDSDAADRHAELVANGDYLEDENPTHTELLNRIRSITMASIRTVLLNRIAGKTDIQSKSVLLSFHSLVNLLDPFILPIAEKSSGVGKPSVEDFLVAWKDLIQSVNQILAISGDDSDLVFDGFVRGLYSSLSTTKKFLDWLVKSGQCSSQRLQDLIFLQSEIEDQYGDAYKIISKKSNRSLYSKSHL